MAVDKEALHLLPDMAVDKEVLHLTGVHMHVLHWIAKFFIVLNLVKLIE